MKNPIIWGMCILCSAHLAAEEKGSRQGINPPVPKTVTIEGDALKLSDALKALQKQTEFAVGSRLSDDPTLKLKIRDKSFWEAADTIAVAAGGRLNPHDPPTIEETQKGSTPPPVCYSGPFRISLKRINVGRDFNTGIASCSAILEVRWEPGERVFYMNKLTSTFKVLDEKQQALPAFNEGIKLETVTDRSAWDVELRLPAAPRSSATFGLIEGTLSVKGTDRMETIEFASLKEAKPVAREHVSVRIVESLLQGENWRVTLEITHPEGGPKFETFQTWISQDEIAIESIKGQTRLEYRGEKNIDIANDTKTRVTYFFPAPGKDGKKPTGKPEEWKLTYRTPGKLFDIPVTFSFKNVPLP